LKTRKREKRRPGKGSPPTNWVGCGARKPERDFTRLSKESVKLQLTEAEGTKNARQRSQQESRRGMNVFRLRWRPKERDQYLDAKEGEAYAKVAFNVALPGIKSQRRSVQPLKN